MQEGMNETWPLLIGLILTMTIFITFLAQTASSRRKAALAGMLPESTLGDA